MKRFYDYLYHQIDRGEADHMIHTFFGDDVKASAEEFEIHLQQGDVQFSIRPMYEGYAVETSSTKSPLLDKVVAMTGVYLDETVSHNYLQSVNGDRWEDGPARYGIV